MSDPDLASLVDDLSSPDPVRRDEGAFNHLGELLLGEEPVGDEPAREVHRLATDPSGPLGSCGRPAGDESVYGRSFTIILLAVLTRRDSGSPFLTQAQWSTTVSALTRVATTERDFRAHDPQHGWVHVVAHCADLADEILDSPRCDESTAKRVLDALCALIDRADLPFGGDEEDRLALALAGALERGQESVPGLASRVDGADLWPIDSVARANWKAVVRSLPFRLVARGADARCEDLVPIEALLTRL